MAAILTFHPIYKFEGTTFEFHHFCGPCPLNEDGDPIEPIPEDFWNLFDRWNKLTQEEKEKTQTQKGGCYRI